MYVQLFIQVLTREKQILIKELEVRNNILKTINTKDNDECESVEKHKVMIASADKKKYNQRRNKQFYCNKSKGYTKEDCTYREPPKSTYKSINSELGKSKLNKPNEGNLDNNCQSCLIFPEKDGSFIIPQRNGINNQPEDELDKLIKNYNKSQKEYISHLLNKYQPYIDSHVVFQIGRAHV